MLGCHVLSLYCARMECPVQELRTEKKKVGVGGSMCYSKQVIIVRLAQSE